MTKEDTELSKGDAAKDGLKSQGKACVSGFSKFQQGLMQERRVQSRGSEDPPKEEMATRSSVLAGKAGHF